MIRRRLATTIGAVGLGLVALLFAQNADEAQRAFAWAVSRAPLAPLVVTPAAFALIVFITRRFVPDARGSGIPQVIAGAYNSGTAGASLTSLRTAGFKYILTLCVLLVGGSAGREGPTVQISAAIMKAMHRWFRIELTSAVVIAGGAAGVSAAFNTPLAGVAFAIEELASAYEQRLAVLVMGAVMISGLVSLGLAGDYLYFGAMRDIVTLKGALVLCPVAGIVGGVCGGLFSRAILAFGSTNWRVFAEIRKRPIIWATFCGVLIAVVGVASSGKTWGTGYDAARTIIEGHGQPLWFGPAKLFVTLLTTLSGAPGGNLCAFAFGRRWNRRCPGDMVPRATGRSRGSPRHDRLLRRRHPVAFDRGAHHRRNDGQPRHDSAAGRHSDHRRRRVGAGMP